MSIVVAWSFLEGVRAQLAADARLVVRVRAGVRRRGQDLTFFLPSTQSPRDATANAFLFHEPPDRSQTLRALADRGTELPALELCFGADGGALGRLLVGAMALEVDEVLVSGPRMQRWHRARPSSESHASPGRAGARRLRAQPPTGSLARERLNGLQATIVGCARLGSAVALGLARAGVGELTLVDDDVLEDHSLDAVECFADGAGRPKVEAVAAYLASVAPLVRVHALAEPVESPSAFDACAAAHLVASAPDDNRARLAAALAAAAHLRPHLDVGTGVFAGRAGWSAGADVRLMLPGLGCVLCAGGLDLSRRRTSDWRRQRAGSLRSLNQMAAGQAVALVERLLAGDLTRSLWMRLTLHPNGELAAEEMPWVVDPTCRICGRRTGSGDAVLAT